jgi:hypothetical protein
MFGWVLEGLEDCLPWCEGGWEKQFTLTPFLDKLLPMTQDEWEKTPPAVKSTRHCRAISCSKQTAMICPRFIQQDIWRLPFTKADATISSLNQSMCLVLLT